MLLRKSVLDGIEDGTIDLAFRRWIRPTVKTEGTLRTAAGLLEIRKVERVDIDSITPDDARRAGLELEDLVSFLQQKTEGHVYRVQLGSIGPDPRVALREDDRLSEEELSALIGRLERLDRASKRGPWTREFLELLDRSPHVRAQDLADQLGLDKTCAHWRAPSPRPGWRRARCSPKLGTSQ